MFSLLLRDTVRSLRNLSLLKSNLPNTIVGFDYSTFTPKDFIYDNSDETGTLLTRFVKYLAMENSKFDPLVPTTIRYPDFFPITDVKSFQSELKNIDVAQIPHLIVFAFTYKSNGDPIKFVHMINEVDKFCEQNLKDMDLDTILRTLYALMFLIPNKITKMNFFNKALNRLVADFNENCPNEKFVKVCFYLGLGKKNSNSVNLLKKYLRSYLSLYLPEMTAMDLSIVGNAAYKASVPIGDAEFAEKLQSEILKLDSDADDALLVNLLKIMRHHRIKSDDLCVKLDEICTEKTLQRFQFTGIAHIFAYFAECQWNDKEVCSKFIDEAIARIRDSSERLRAKDISTFLWCCAQLQQRDLLRSDDLKLIDDLLVAMIDRNEFKYLSDQLIDCALSLWMMGFQSRRLIAEVTSLRMNPHANNPERAKLDTRHKVLISCVSIEKPDWMMRKRQQVFVESLAAPEYLMKNRIGLNVVCDKLRADGVDMEVVTPIEGVNFAGLLVRPSKDQKCYIEVLDNEHFLKFNDVPSAIVQLKTRLLRQLGHNVVVIRTSDLDKLKNIQDLIGTTEEAKVKQNVAVLR